ncbi:ABC-type lipoprotein release transport system permease subunit [Rathayibacter sp. PhB127]|uniref:ABC transporter permease n=1 Tax=unclassified Rathayibacter TaxID=2609250 RepID=UPI000F4BCB42|nr:MULTISPECIES: FtsX-like permease family protein [unclassified Rathayibacter]ROS25405.1 ABC-type lipoprotein release transport system permease subunit [Rathayibacter sp. PhB127]TDX76062.1 ABC-type lipoprotein release transport system permease subunit [Rathayibacter sp. PhB151]
MFATYLRRELTNRRRQTMIIAAGMALAIALVILVTSFSAGVRSAQASVLESVYGVGTDITVTQAAAAPTEGEAPGQRFDFGSTDGTTDDGTTSVSQSRLEPDRGTTTFDASAVATAQGVTDVSAAIGVLALNNTTFSGQLPDSAQQGGTDGATGQGTAGTAPAAGEAPAGGPDGAGGSSFGVDSFSVLGLDPAGSAIGPLADVSLTDGRTFTADDAGQDVVVVDSSYATTASLSVGSTVDIGGTDFSVIGIVTTDSTDASTASDTYIPLDVAQTLSGQAGLISSVYVQAASSEDISSIQTALQTALPDATVSTQADLASSVSGSLSTAGSLVANLGTWLSLLVLAAAFLIAILFTVSGVTRRTREFGTLKAIGWSNGAIVRQVAGESVVQGLIGGAAGIVLGLVGVTIVNLIAPTLSGTSTTTSAMGAGGPGGGFGGGGPGAAQTATATEVALSLPVTVPVILLAVGLAVLGGLLAGALGGWRASRLRPAAALRSVG